MDMIFARAATASGLFADTNVDDMVVLAVLNVSSRAGGRPAAWQIWGLASMPGLPPWSSSRCSPRSAWGSSPRAGCGSWA